MLVVTSATAAATSTTERAALTDLAHATNLARWIRRRNWLSNHSVCAWQLVGCDETGRVKTLSLDFTGLHGTLPTSIGALTHLEALDLEGNSLSGSVPSELGQLTSLVQLGLGGTNAFEGALPPSLCPVLDRIVNATSSPQGESTLLVWMRQTTAIW